MKGTIIGDIAGSKYEFDNTSDYNFEMFAPDSSYTDDTICSIAVADAILSASDPRHPDYKGYMRRWCRKYPHPMGEYGGSFAAWVANDNPRPYGSYGNGSAMRVSPVAWLYDSEDDVRVQAEASAAITHNHPEGIRGAVAIAVAIYRMRMTADKTPSIFDSVAREFYGDKPFDRLPPCGVFDVTCQGCVPLSLRIVSQAGSFEDAVRRAVVYGGDTDTVGAIVGSLAEARFGLPPQMVSHAVDRLPYDMRSVLDRFAQALK